MGSPILHAQDHSGDFSNISNLLPIGATDSWGVSWVDIDNDGYEDLFITDKDETIACEMLFAALVIQSESIGSKSFQF